MKNNNAVAFALVILSGAIFASMGLIAEALPTPTRSYPEIAMVIGGIVALLGGFALCVECSNGWALLQTLVKDGAKRLKKEVTGPGKLIPKKVDD